MKRWITLVLGLSLGILSHISQSLFPISINLYEIGGDFDDVTLPKPMGKACLTLKQEPNKPLPYLAIDWSSSEEKGTITYSLD